MELLKLLSTNELVAQLLSFFLVFFLLRKFAWGRLLKLLDDRKERIATEFKNIEDAKLEVALLKKEYEIQVASLEAQAQKRILQVTIEEKKIAADTRKQVYQEAQGIIDEARRNIRFELLKAKEELKEKVIELTISATEMVIKEKLTEDTDKKLVRDFLNRIDEIE